MNALIVYDSKFGNTALIARAVGEGLAPRAEVSVVGLDDAVPDIFACRDLIIAGSPTHAFRPTTAMKSALKQIPRGGIAQVRIAAFDTRISPVRVKSRILRGMMTFFGYAAEPIAKQLAEKGGIAVVPPEGFFVRDSEGPLEDGELERAKSWGETITANLF